MHFPLLAYLVYSATASASSPLPVIIDTDIGTDFDDSVALAYAVKSPELDVRLVVTATDDTTARARIVAKYLSAYGRDDIPIGIGIKASQTGRSLYDWASDVNLTPYKGGVYQDGVAKMADVIKKSEVPVTIIAIAPATNFPSLLQRFPDVVKNARVSAMSGSIYRGYDNSTNAAAEYNVKVCPDCTSKMYSSAWNVTITPLDTCGVVTLSHGSWDTLLKGDNKVAPVLMASWIFWCLHGHGCSLQPGAATDVFFDAVAVLLCESYAGQLIDFQTLKVAVTSDGHTVVSSEKGSSIDVAIKWKEDGLSGFESKLAQIISMP
eukprot:m.309910 g.309910  ORF g.309910 m.309910 type:complete len:321 (+) comp48529_c0_seq1:23-985(+)